MNSKLIQEIWQNHNGKITGAVIGLFIGIFIITFGFFRTFFVLLCMVAGYIIGKRIDEKEDIMDILEKMLPPGYHR
ncbi:hypothetical protein P22_0363 [Propionispora sp. 2/2-37]|uniref:DUF2273 domain-containing protein n=1 Tax=Propionispora sp. 2/2-37 TaxID=1677858 RepID=UPI0006BB5FAD|nr:DUF2273 domain-containing protein [Propionispora sp. 2/2-37]CUH94297.1 hypothetical protein P22_0363 [Propionispora sp. 2/2-37]